MKGYQGPPLVVVEGWLWMRLLWGSVLFFGKQFMGKRNRERLHLTFSPFVFTESTAVSRRLLYVLAHHMLELVYLVNRGQ